MAQLYKREKRSAEFNSRDHEAFNAARFEKYVEDEVVKFCNDLPKEADYILMQDLAPVGVKTFFYFLNGVPAVRKVTVYEVSADNLHVRLDAEFDVPVDVQLDVTTGPKGQIALDVVPAIPAPASAQQILEADYVEQMVP